MHNEVNNWINYSRSSNEYARGVEDFLDYAFSTRAEGDQKSCPCKECYNRFWYRRNEVYNHLIANGIGPEIKEWHFKDKGISSRPNTQRNIVHDNMESLIYDTHRDLVDKLSNDYQGRFHEDINEHANVEAKKFFKLVEDGKQELYPGCKSFSKLSFIIRLYLFKCVHGLSNIAFSDLLEIIQDLIPEVQLPKSFNEARKLVKDLGLHYQKIDACRNDCMLFWKDHESATSCHVCHASRWKKVEKQQGINDIDLSQHASRIPAKVVWHFPLKPRLQRLYMCAETTNYMRWHDEKRIKDGNLRHPADGKAWKDFDSLYPHFARESHNVRLGLASDGFNPFRTMSTTHSTWPVVLINYNLPPWLFMKSEYLILSLLIPGPLSPGNDIDVYLQPLVEELKDLWEFGVDTYDASKRQTFEMRVALQSTTSDFPGYAMLSGWSTKGRYACPYCHYETEHLYLNHSRKSCYMAHHRFLDANHCWRHDKKSFNGEIEKRSAPDPLTGTEILHLLQDFKNKFSKTLFCEVLKNVKLPQGCASNIARCVQMHELKISGYKSHDAHILMQYLLQVAVRKTLPKHVAIALITLSAFFRGICNKVVNPQDLDLLQREIVEILCIFEKIFPPSFFDIMIHLPIHLVNEVRLSGPVTGWWMYPIERYLGKLKSYVRNRSRPEGSIAEGYLAEECLIFCSRYLHDDAKKKSKIFNQRYEKVVATHERSPIFPKMGHPLGRRKKGKKGAFSLDSDTQKIAHRYVLFNCQDGLVEKYIEDHEDMIKNKSRDKQRKRWRQAQQHSQEFMVWFREKVESEEVPDHIKWLTLGPSNVARRYIGYFINGYSFCTQERDAKCKTQNSGVTLTALTSSFSSTKDHNPSLDGVTYYGRIQEIIELDYWGSFNVILFRCEWFHVENDVQGLTRVNFNKLCYGDDPFVLAS